MKLGEILRAWPVDSPPAYLDQPSRTAKGEKVIALLASHRPLSGTRSLEVGCGAGYLAAMLAEAAGPSGHVSAVDVEDWRQIEHGFDFALVTGTQLPYPGESFDIVVSNQVIEHVGDRTDQHAHLREIKRVLAPNGIVFLSLPNSRFPFERHFRLPFVTQLPRRLRSPYIRVMGRGREYSVDIPSPRSVRQLARVTGFEVVEITSAALQEYRRIEKPRGIVAALFRLPAPVFRWCVWLAPSKTYLLKRATGSGSD